MTDVFLGGTPITDVQPAGAGGVRVAFRADGHSGRVFQLYVGRTLAAVTRSTTQRVLFGQVPPGDRAVPLRIAAVVPSLANTDHGKLLADHAWRSYRILWTPPDPVPSDLAGFDVVMSTTAGGSYDVTNIKGHVPYEAGKASYEYTVHVDETGDWEFAVITRDQCRPSGNEGTADFETVAATVLPADLAVDSAGNRFSVSVSSGTATFDFTYPA